MIGATGDGRASGMRAAMLVGIVALLLPTAVRGDDRVTVVTADTDASVPATATLRPKDEVGARLERKILELRDRSRRAMLDRLQQQQISPAQEAAMRRDGRHVLVPGEPIWIQSGKSRVIELRHPVKRVQIGNPDLAGIVVLTPTTIVINAKPLPERKSNTPDMMPVNGFNDTTPIGKTLTPEPHVAETTLIVWGGDREYDVHNVMVADFIDQQVMLEVTVAELRRTALEQHGIDVRVVQQNFISAYFLGGSGGPGVPGESTTVPPEIFRPLLPLTLTQDRPTYAFILPDQNITGFIEALQDEGLATILARPKIMSLSGQNAAFQVGGEIPIRIASGFTATVVFKPFGTIVNFLPRVSDEGDIMLTVTPEVSQPDFTRTVDGVPSFRTRRAATSAHMRNGETLLVGGLLQTIRDETVRGVPYLMNIPVIGYVFRNTRYENEMTELWVIVTPHLIHPLADGNIPADSLEPLKNSDVNTQSDPAEASRPRLPWLVPPPVEKP
jgi:Flp pilus assembly secretin CpaC